MLDIVRHNMDALEAQLRWVAGRPPLERLMQTRTTVVIAHRLSTIRNADCIYVMEHGKLIEWGRHEQLLDQQGIYASLWRVQMGLR